MANSPIWVTRKVGLHASYRVRWTDAAACIAAGYGGSQANCEADPWWHMVTIAGQFPDGPVDRLIKHLKRTRPFLENAIGKDAARFASPFAQCDLCFGRGHGKNKGTYGKKGKNFKAFLSLKGTSGSLGALKRAQQLGILQKGNVRDLVDVKALHSVIGQGCIVGEHIWDNLETYHDDPLRTNVIALQELSKQALRPPQVGPRQGLGIPKIWLHGKAGSTRDLRTAGAAIEAPHQAYWMAYSPLQVAATRLDQRQTCDRWKGLADLVLGLFFQKRCIWCSGGGHYWYQCAGFQPFKHADWAGDADLGFWLRPMILYHTPDAVTRAHIRNAIATANVMLGNNMPQVPRNNARNGNLHDALLAELQAQPAAGANRIQNRYLLSGGGFPAIPGV